MNDNQVHVYVNQESLQRLMLTLTNGHVIQTDAEMYIRGMQRLLNIAIVGGSRSNIQVKGPAFSLPHLRVLTNCRQAVWGAIGLKLSKNLHSR